MTKKRSCFICFIGIDGSGKTLQAKRLESNLREQGIDCTYRWFRYSTRVLKPLMRLIKCVTRKSKGDSGKREFASSKKRMMKNPLLSWIWRNLSAIEYLVQATIVIRPLFRKSRVVVCDRYMYDMVTDLAINLGRTGDDVVDLLRHPALKLLPVPDKVFFLDVPPDIAYSRKQDPDVISEDYLITRADIYSHISDKLGFVRIDGTKSIEEIAEIVLTECKGQLTNIGNENKN